MNADAPAVEIARHRTAMVRHSLSQPVGLLVRFGLLHPGVSMFDYGCGQGDDQRALLAGGIDATGWDPHYAPDRPQTEAEVVNLGFVLNVIENPAERTDALLKAWSLTRSVLAVSTMIVGQVPVDGLTPYRDGYISSRGTFQKYYQHAELRAFLAKTLGVEPIAAAPGIFFIFRREEDQAEHMLARRSQRSVSASAYRSQRKRASVPEPRPNVADRIAIELETLSEIMLERGRVPQIDEVPSVTLEGLAAQRVSLGRALDLVRSLTADDMLVAAQARRREDLVVHQALSMLNPSRTAVSPRIVRDIRALFGSRTALAERAREYLFSLADADLMRRAIAKSAGDRLGIVDARGRLVFDGGSLNELPGAVRCFAGCVTHLSGEPTSEFLYRLDPVRRRATLIMLDDTKTALPTSSHDVRVDLRRQDVTVVAKRRRFLRWADLNRLGPRTKQRITERQHRDATGIDDQEIFETIS